MVYWGKDSVFQFKRLTIILAASCLLLPYEDVKRLGEHLGAVKDSKYSHSLDCKLLNLTSLVLFYFTGVEIKVPIRDLIRQKNGQCHLSLNVADTSSELGLDILQSVYLVVDLLQLVVGMGQVAVSPRKCTIEEMKLILLMSTPMYLQYTCRSEILHIRMGMGNSYA